MKYNYFKPHDYDRSQTVISLLEQSMKKNKDKIAIVCNERRITYGELDILSDKIANYLKKQGSGKEKVVGILLHRSAMMIVAAIGALKSGAAYQPLDPSYPDDRLSFMIEDSEAVALITEEGLRQKLSNFTGAVLDINDVEKLEEPQEKNYSVSPDDLFILLYTSGSTGIPKGVMLEHKNLVAFIDWYTRYYSLCSESRVAAYASFGFDASMMDTYPILCEGGQLHIITEEIRLDFPQMHSYFEDNKITHCFITTQVGRQYARMYPESMSMKHLSVGGETLVPIDPPKYNFYNAYGPTECTIFSTIFKVDRLYKNVPIGYPLDNVRLYIVDENGAQVENGTEGELWISGTQVARDYFKRPEKNAEVFIKNPFSDDPEFSRVYRTGDIVKGYDDGTIEFLGRRDRQVKIRGFRIELSEIEEVILRFEGIKDATVVAFDTPSGGKYIAAYIVSDEKINIDALNNFIAQTKPPYMIPAFTMQIDKIPLNQNSKVDRKKLPVPEYNSEEYEAPETETEKMICEKMAKVLGLNAVGVNDDFFKIGGDSLSTIVLIIECSHAGVNISSIHQYHTPRALAEYCDSLEIDEDIPAKNADAIKKAHSLTQGQIMYLNLQKDAPEVVYNNEPFLLKFVDNIDLNRMKDVVNKVLKNHPALSTKIFKDETGNYRQIYDESLFTPITITDVSDEEFETLKENFVKIFEITGKNFCRGEIYRTPSAAYLFLDFHHIVVDGFSLRLIFDEIYSCYQDESYKLPQDFYFYLIDSLERAKDSKNWKEAAAHCDKIFRSADSLKEEEMSLKPDFEVAKFKGAFKMFPISVPKEKLRGNVAYLTACALAVCAYNNTNRAFVRFIHYGRNNSSSMSSVGLFANYYPVFLVKEENDTPETLVAKIQAQVSFIEAHIDYPYFEGNIVNPDRTVRFIYQKDIMDVGHIKNLVQELIRLDINDSDMTDSLFGVSVVDDVSVSKDNLIFVERYAGNCYREENEENFRNLFFDAVKYLAGN